MPPVKAIFLRLLQPIYKTIAYFLKILAILLGLPVIADHLFDSLLIKLRLRFQLVDPDNLVHNFRKVSDVVECFVGFSFVEHFNFNFVDVFSYLGQQLRLVLIV